MEIFHAKPGSQTRWTDFENPMAAPGAGGQENGGAKGHAFDRLEAGQTVTLMTTQGSGVVRRIWVTLSGRSPRILRSLVLRMYWDGCAEPAVCCPLGDFFGFGLARMTAFDSELFSSPEGRSMNCFVPMPFYESARITLTNESDESLKRLFYEVDFTLEPLERGRALYFHAYWNRQCPTSLCEDYPLLPQVRGCGRFLGASMGVFTDDRYKGAWFGEGEVKVYLDGDNALPTLAGTGIEDYIGTAWGQGVFACRTQGSPISDMKAGRFSFYRWHVPDPIYFQSACRVGVQQIGGAPCDVALRLVESGAPIRIVSADSDTQGFQPLFEAPGYTLNGETAIKDAWYNFYREDDWASTAYFYLDSPSNGLPAMPPLEARLVGCDDPDANI